MSATDFPIDHPTKPGRYEAAAFPLEDADGPTGFNAYTVKADGSTWLEQDDPNEWVEVFTGPWYRVEDIAPFRRIDADGKPLPTTPHVIGLVGKKRTGKDTTARELARHGYQPAAFADPLRDLALAIDPVVGFYDRRTIHPSGAVTMEPAPVYYSEALAEHGYEAAKEAYPEFRRFLQRLGTEGVRDTLGTKYGLRDMIGDDLWIVLAEQRIQAAKTPLVFTDVRFPNEADLIERYGNTVRVLRPSLPPSTDDHPSETALDARETDETLTNDSTPEGLAAAVDALVATL